MRLLAAALLLVMLAPLAAAHASLQSADPAPNGHVDPGVDMVSLTFTENVEKQYTTMAVHEVVTGKDMAAGSVLFDDAHPNVIRLPVQPLQDGIYAVDWKALSVDSHTTQGSYLFSVGTAQLKLIVPVEAHAHVDDSAQVLREGGARLVYYASLFVSLGAPAFALVIDRETRPPRTSVAAATLVASLAGIAAAYAGLWLLADRIDLGLGATALTTAGASFDWRGTLLMGSAVFFALALLWRRARVLGLAAGALLAVGSLLAAALGSHAAADRSLTQLSIAVDVAHMLMGSLWIGGVCAFLLVVRGRSSQDVGRLVTRFTPLAIASVALILLTGTIASVRRIPTFADLATTPYGRLVSLKILLMAPLVALGAYNKQVAGPRLLAGGASAAPFRRSLAIEALVMAIVLGAAGALASSSPPDTAVQEGTQTSPPYVEFAQATPTTHVVMEVAPNPIVVGIQNITIELHPLTGVSVAHGASIEVKIAPPNGTEPDTFVDPGPTRLTDDTWALQGGYFTSPGKWNVWILVQRPEVGEFSTVHFIVGVQAPAG